MILSQIGDARRHNLQILHEVYEEGADTGEPRLEHSSSEGGYVLEGALEVSVGADIRLLHPGDSYLFDSRIPRRFRNVHGGRTVVISACTPACLQHLRLLFEYATVRRAGPHGTRPVNLRTGCRDSRTQPHSPA